MQPGKRAVAGFVPSRLAAYLYQRFTRGEQTKRLSKLIAQNGLDVRGAGVPASQQDDARRRAKPGDKFSEVAVFGNEGVCRRPGGGKHVAIRRSCQPEIAHLEAGLAELIGNPAREGRRQMIIQPYRHSAAMSG
jgi:hypothetical protein